MVNGCTLVSNSLTQWCEDVRAASDRDWESRKVVVSAAKSSRTAETIALHFQARTVGART